MQHKLQDGRTVRLPVSEQKAGRLGASHRAVHGRNAHMERIGKFLKRQPRFEGEFHDDDEILRVELHG